MDGLLHYDTPFGFANPRAITLPPLSRRVVLFLIDGLGDEPSRALPFLNELRARGVDLKCSIGLPSLSLPGRAVMVTGAWQEVHGQMTNKNPRPVRVEHIFENVRKQGLATALAAGPGTQTMFSPHVSRTVVYVDMAETDTLEAYQADQARQSELLCRGFARLKCEDCDETHLVAFSCKGRGYVERWNMHSGRPTRRPCGSRCPERLRISVSRGARRSMRRLAEKSPGAAGVG